MCPWGWNILTLFTPIQYCHCLVVLSSSPVKSTAQNMSAPSTQFDPSQINVLQFKGWGKEVQQCPDCCVFHHGEFLNNTRKYHVRRITIILHSSVGPHASSNHPDPETEDIVDIYSAAITDKREWNGENGRTESVIGLLFKDGHYSEWNLNQKYDLGRQWENKNHDIRFKKTVNVRDELKRETEQKWSQETVWKMEANQKTNSEHLRWIYLESDQKR